MDFAFHFHQIEPKDEFIKYAKDAIKEKLSKVTHNEVGKGYKVIIYFNGQKNLANCKVTLDGKTYYHFDHYFPNNWQKVIDRISEKIENRFCN